MVIGGYRSLYLVIGGYTWFLIVVSGYRWLHMVIWSWEPGQIYCKRRTQHAFRASLKGSNFLAKIPLHYCEVMNADGCFVYSKF